MARKPPAIRPFAPLDVKGGDLTYGQRLELGGILVNREGKKEYEVFLDTIECLYGRKPLKNEYKQAVQLFKSAVEGYVFWMEAEEKHLKYTPTKEEKDAGLDKYAAEVGEIGTAYAMAEKFGKDPDEILGWKYGKVFHYLRKQKAEGDFQRRYSEVMARKNKMK